MYAPAARSRFSGFVQPILFVNGIFLVVLALGMCVPAVVDFLSDRRELWVFPVAAGITMFIGCGLALTNVSSHPTLSSRQIFIITTSIWIIIPAFGAIPFMLSELRMSFTDAFFESMSGVTTTGSTVITGLDRLPAGLLIWRGILQWLGGLGIMVMSFSIMPLLRVGGMQIFKIEAFEPGDKTVPRAAQISVLLTLVYVALTLACGIALGFCGMNGVEAAVHAMTTIATGGYSTSDASIGHFNSATVEVVVTVGMVLGGTPFMLILMAVRGRPGQLFGNTQFRCYLAILACSTLAVAGWLILHGHPDPVEALRIAAFNVTSIMTGTGYAAEDYMTWGAFPIFLLFFLTFVGGCSGSTSCGIKVFRFQIVAAVVGRELTRIFSPNSVSMPRYGGIAISQEAVTSVMNFMAAFVFGFAGLTLALGLLGLDFITAASSAATAISNVGPGLGPVVGPSGNFQSLPDAAKWLLAAGMVVGRLEVMTVLVLFSRQFWRD
jgi:trk system potassium uptake protein TrkH